jgi:hypothetical protein
MVRGHVGLQLRDRGILLRLNHDRIGREYLDRWSSTLGVDRLLEEVRRAT